MRALDGNLIDRVREQGYDVHVLDDSGASSQSTWLGVALESELTAMRRLLAQRVQPRWIVVDHYELEAVWEKELGARGIQMCAIDDLADRAHDTDLLLDATLDEPARYDSLVPRRTRKFLGLKYAPLRDAFTLERERARVRTGKIERVLVFYGGVDWTGETLKAMDALSTFQDDFVIDVVCGALNPRLVNIQKAVDADPRARLLAGNEDMASITAAADLALGAIGTAMWERLFVGCPAIVTATLDKTRPLGAIMGETGAVEWLGFAGETSPASIRSAMRALIDDVARVREMGARGFALANGYAEARLEFIEAFD